MKYSQIFLMLIVVVLMAAGQVLFKLAALDFKKFKYLDIQTLIAASTNAFLIAGTALYGLTTILWVVVLRDADLSRAYPFVALTMVLVPAAGVILFNEPISGSLVLGGALIAAGVFVISLGARSN